MATNRPTEARAAIGEARKTAPPPPDSFLAEALLLDREGREAEAQAAYEQAVQGGSVSSYPHYRLATLRWRPQADRETLAAIEKLLLRAVSLNVRHAPSNALLGEVRSLLGVGEPLPFVRRAIALAPSNPSYRLTAARILFRQQKYDEALLEARAGLALAQSDDAQREAQALLTSIDRAKAAK